MGSGSTLEDSKYSLSFFVLAEHLIIHCSRVFLVLVL